MLELRGSGAEPLEADDPRLIGRTALAGRLGAGGMGRVYLGVLDGRYVAVKQLLASVVGEDEDFRRRFGHELDNLARLPEEATAPLLDSDRTANPPWFATAYIPGLTLREALALHGGPLPARALWLLLREAAEGLAAVHALDMVHRDLKPSNVMLTLDGLTLIDFGVARAAEQSQLTRTGMVVGTPAYMAPEQASGARALSGATDVFALGSVLAYAACGRPPFGEESGHGVLYRIVHEEPDLEPLRELDAALADLVAACLAKDPGDRPTAAELLERAAGHGPFEGPPWPGAVAERLAERAAFAARVQEIDVPTLPLGGGEPAPGAQAPAGTGAAARPERRRRTRVLLAVLPVVVVAGGTTLAVQYLPHVTAPSRAGAQPSVSSPVPGAAQGPAPAPSSAPSGPQPSASGGSPSGPASAPPGAQSPVPGQGPGAQPAPPAANTGAGPGPAPGTGTAPTAGTPNGSGGGSTGTPGGGGTPPKPIPPPTSGTHRYSNGDNGQCITQVFGASDYGSCSDATARWTVRSQGDGGFKLVNQQTGGCLYGNMLGQAVFVGDCGQDIARTWRTGAGGTLRNDWNGGCLDLGMNSGLVTNSCDGKASQRWSPQ
ncbi:protein kinase domain-containing protein [Streptomyces sp. NBC_00158]|uniref:serine/threonine-protein kinase n=1 Tax=Streptomyces sp. NBC_00158 TaxID=2903627 RepID=UPI003252138D